MSVLEMSEPTVRQRRNLLAITVVLILIHHGGVRFGNDLRLFGTSVHINNPEVIFTFLNVVQAYFVWRFYQYFHADKAYAELRNQYRNTVNQAFDKFLKDYIFKFVPEGRSITGFYSFENVRRTKVVNGAYSLKLEYPSPKGEVTESKLVDVPVSLFAWYRKVPLVISFAFRGRILTDFYLPFGLVIYSLALNFI
ncbi:hypothetical protein [Vibrio europaeus]|uniref:hypothetical protein n=1 Tax=Vibrio europaeus TaxID=300876 RepID=UPI0039E143FB